MNQGFDSVSKELEAVKKTTKEGGEYWMARDILLILKYASWEKFAEVIDRARRAAASAGLDPDNQFHQTVNMVEIGSGARRSRVDYFLTRYACYLITMNGDTSKKEIGIAQTYFATQARRQEIQDKLTAEERRILHRKRVTDANKKLGEAAKNAGVENYGLFHDAGYRGLYDMGLTEIKKRKDIPAKEDLLDRAGRSELAANEFRITQTEERLIRESISNERDAKDTHFRVARKIRTTIKELQGTMPEDMPPEESVKKIESRRKKELGGRRKKELPPPDEL
jgi:DNA-damage-inducible protein D